MRILPLSAILAAATIVGAPVLAQPAATAQPRLAALIRQDASLRDRIGRIQLDALVARIDQTFDRKVARAEQATALQRDLDLYAF